MSSGEEGDSWNDQFDLSASEDTILPISNRIVSNVTDEGYKSASPAASSHKSKPSLSTSTSTSSAAKHARARSSISRAKHIPKKGSVHSLGLGRVPATTADKTQRPHVSGNAPSFPSRHRQANSVAYPSRPTSHWRDPSSSTTSNGRNGSRPRRAISPYNNSVFSSFNLPNHHDHLSAGTLSGLLSSYFRGKGRWHLLAKVAIASLALITVSSLLSGGSSGDLAEYNAKQALEAARIVADMQFELNNSPTTALAVDMMHQLEIDGQPVVGGEEQRKVAHSKVAKAIKDLQDMDSAAKEEDLNAGLQVVGLTKDELDNAVSSEQDDLVNQLFEQAQKQAAAVAAGDPSPDSSDPGLEAAQEDAAEADSFDFLFDTSDEDFGTLEGDDEDAPVGPPVQALRQREGDPQAEAETLTAETEKVEEQAVDEDSLNADGDDPLLARDQDGQAEEAEIAEDKQDIPEHLRKPAVDVGQQVDSSLDRPILQKPNEVYESAMSDSETSLDKQSLVEEVHDDLQPEQDDDTESIEQALEKMAQPVVQENKFAVPVARPRNAGILDPRERRPGLMDPGKAVRLAEPAQQQRAQPVPQVNHPDARLVKDTLVQPADIDEAPAQPAVPAARVMNDRLFGKSNAVPFGKPALLNNPFKAAVAAAGPVNEDNHFEAHLEMKKAAANGGIKPFRPAAKQQPAADIFGRNAAAAVADDAAGLTGRQEKIFGLLKDLDLRDRQGDRQDARSRGRDKRRIQQSSEDRMREKALLSLKKAFI